jgi:hypothetical protein
MEHVELAVADLDPELLPPLGVGDRHPEVIVVRPPQQPDVDAVIDATMQLMCGCWG